MGRQRNGKKGSPGVRRRTDSSSVAAMYSTDAAQCSAVGLGAPSCLVLVRCPIAPLPHHTGESKSRKRDRKLPTVRHAAAILTLDSLQYSSRYRSLYRHRYCITQKAVISDKLHHRVGKCIS